MAPPAALVVLVGTGYDLYIGLDTATRAYDQALLSTAVALEPHLVQLDGEPVFRLPPAVEDVLRADRHDQVFFAVRTPDGRHVAGDADLPALPSDQLQAALSGGDLSVQACADDPQVAYHAVRNLARMARGTAATRWTVIGFGRAEPAGLAALGALPVALLVAGIGASLGGPTGYAINPARDLGPRIAHAILPIKGKGSSDWSYSWVPIVGPLIGGALAGVAATALLPVL